MNKEQISAYLEEQGLDDIFMAGFMTKLPNEGDITEEIVQDAFGKCAGEHDRNDSDYQDNIIGWYLVMAVVIDVLEQQQ